MAAASPVNRVDHTALKVNQAALILLSTTAFLLDQPLLVAALAVVLLIGSRFPALALFQQLYRRLLLPAGLLRPDLREDDPQPHRFAQLVGGSVLSAATLAFVAAAPVVGWSLTALVVLLAALNLFSGFCAGCFLYFQLSRLQARRG